jgi:hypothetical protein
MHFIAGMIVIKMMHVSTSALCLVFLSSLVEGFPTSTSDQNTKGPTKIELLDARGDQRTATGEPTTMTAVDSPGNIERSYSDSSAAVGVSSSCSLISLADNAQN